MQPAPSFGSEGSASDILRQTEAHYERAIQALGALIHRIESGDLGARSEVQQTATDVRKAMQTFFDERKKLRTSFDGTPASYTPSLSTSTPQEMRSGAAWIASEPPELQNEFLDGLTEQTLMALPFMFEFWAPPHQLPPEGEWFTWVILGGRGAGKTRAGAEWVRSMVEGSKPLDFGKARRVALVGETTDQVREVMIFGDSGILACSPPDRRPVGGQPPAPRVAERRHGAGVLRT